ncbi:Hypothetical predicted protein [Olea europaea subsp. europaea]|uniref:Uncharacterized protein n=1 Tax=Olea europaea subsp. europaea TaxID=158383 RepID=A0A8S0PIS8_OLEEU|nr:Hypothetical predicted protein [Olea europaea subsp. europaea]
MESMINFVHEKLKTLAECLMANILGNLKEIEAVNGLMTNFQEKIKKTGASVAVLILLVFLLGCCCRGTAGKTMKAPGRKSTRISRDKFESNPRTYFRDLRGKNE